MRCPGSKLERVSGASCESVLAVRDIPIALGGAARYNVANAMAAMENVALWHERDISHSSAERVILPDAFLALDYMLDRFAWLVEGLVVDPARMRRNLEASHGLVFSQRVLSALVVGVILLAGQQIVVMNQEVIRDLMQRVVALEAARAPDLLVEELRGMVMIGTDSHKRTHTVVAVDDVAADILQWLDWPPLAGG